ncbi:hypothetical protein BJP41_05005 [Candidatus Williamhamiltonella defendens]|uniref:Uncharacterized protein n=1 Tax=Candidatus Williamhamiltonella defendens TaxID=138072 RepID=A0A2D3T1U9_9ENTR|nr:hypothetical protein [Candidatus Hamiltonella defensa]ATW29798.1 hypothetical protein BJP41_05005 [Candidatus Hamiltonella defensa]ATW31772.1 hypothetical protein BJP42_05085 [Candidatus Hamiltonella defensa]
MATKKPRSKFIDIYWIIPRNSNTPSGKVLLTLNERSTFNGMFKKNHLLWAGHKPVREGSYENF